MLVGIGVLIRLGTGALPASAAMPNCTPQALSALGVPNLTVASATVVAAAGSTPEYCDVKGTLTTVGEGGPNGAANFQIKLPGNWRQRFLYLGSGGSGGNLNPSVNPVDLAAALGKGYATAITDMGHTGAIVGGGAAPALWALIAPGTRNEATMTDLFYRVTHQATAAAKQLVEAFYNLRIQHAYFDGCSTGGRQALMEAMRYPDDYDGLISGDPAMDYRNVFSRLFVQKAQLSSSRAYIPASMLPMIDKMVIESCDEVDGAKDGLIQNPAACSFDPMTLFCKEGVSTDCLSWEQVHTLRAYMSGTYDENGVLLYPGQSVSHLNGGMDVYTTGKVTPSFTDRGNPWGIHTPMGYMYVDQYLKYYVMLDPNYPTLSFDVDWQTGVVGEKDLTFFDKQLAGMQAYFPEALTPFIQKGKKLIMYHGFSDPSISPFRTVLFYEQLANITAGGYRKLQDNVQLFMVPGMLHCRGGVGPDTFDTLTALEDWVEKGVAPNQIIASHTEADKVTRTMPLCKFPGQAKYVGSGDVNNSANWACTPNQELLRVGPSGRAAGLTSGSSRTTTPPW